MTRPNFFQKRVAKEMGTSDPTNKKYRNDKKMRQNLKNRKY